MHPLTLKLFAAYVYLQSLFCGCIPDRVNSDFVRLRKDYKVKVQRIGRLDNRVTESSGLAYASDSTFWTHPDGSLSELYLVNLKGELLQTVPLQVQTQDWEDLAQDKMGALYIGDFGNNANTRRSMQVYKLNSETKAVMDTISFSYGDQTEFPPPQERKHYDLEAFFHHKDSLFLFTKSRALKGVTKLYKLPANKAAHSTLQPATELRVQSAITAADISPEQDAFALLGYGRLYLFKPTIKSSVSFKGTRYCLPLGRTGQAEAVLYLSPNQLLISNENGSLYLVTLQNKQKRTQ